MTAIAILAVCMLCPAVSANSQTIVRSFDGDTGPGAAACDAGRTHCGWPDMNVGVNGQQVVQVTWQNVRVYDYDGKLLRSREIPSLTRRPRRSSADHMSRMRSLTSSSTAGS